MERCKGRWEGDGLRSNNTTSCMAVTINVKAAKPVNIM